MKKIVFTSIILLVFLAGLSILLYPYISNYIISIRQSRVVAQYYKDIETLDEEESTELFEAAREYNESLKRKSNRYILSDNEMEEYLNLLDPFGNGIMGTLIIDKIDVNLPIYHGTNEGVLRVGAGHLEGTSLPIGGPGTHTVITGHRGLPSAILLSDLDKMVPGDTFTLNILGDILTYEVDQILVVEPHEMDALAIENDKDYCTLVTCTPVGINSHRLLVRGFREVSGETEETIETQEHLSVPEEAGEIDGKLVAGVILIPPLIVITIYLVISITKLRAKRRTK